jgi:transcriptional regulator with XRE-family HTH domain
MGERIKEIRIDNKMSQKQFAEKICISNSNLCGYEKGNVNPEPPVILLICKKFGVREKYLKYGEPPMYNEKTKSLSTIDGDFFINYKNLTGKDRELINFIIQKILETY